MIHFRPFRNTDPPGLVHLWNSCFADPAATLLRNTTILEFFSLAKPYFDPAGLIVAIAGEEPIGFVHAGFGPGADGKDLDHTTGVVCMIGVLPTARRQGTGTQLLLRAEEYLRQRGARSLAAGAMAPANPFTFALYGGAQSSGFLDSSVLARPFLEHGHYRAEQSNLVFRLRLDRMPNVVDGRFPLLRQQYEVMLAPRHGLTWYEEAAIGPTELHNFQLRHKGTGRVVGRICLWEMETYGQRWNEHAVGILELETVVDLRRQGLAKFLLTMLLRHVHEQFFTLAEVHVPETNEPAIALLRSMGFQHTDTGRRFRRRISALAALRASIEVGRISNPSIETRTD